jgi:hypothetical protein
MLSITEGGPVVGSRATADENARTIDPLFGRTHLETMRSMAEFQFS